MSMNTNLPGRLRNTALPVSHGLFPLFEAVVNSIHAVEEASLSPECGAITVEILRSPQAQFDFNEATTKPGPLTSREIIGFKIRDNGIGFSDDNMKSFETLDSEHKVARGGRGVGRLLWLKAFTRATIESTYQIRDGNGDHKQPQLATRTFYFDAQVGVSDPVITSPHPGANRTTCVHLDGFKSQYRDASLKTATAIADTLLEHCLWYFVRQGGAPTIDIIDEEEHLHLDDIYESHMHSSAVAETLTLKGQLFELTHVKLRANSSHSHIFALCAAQRLVMEEHINGKIPGLYGRIQHEDGDFVYACYVSSTFLDDMVRSERTGFNIPERADALFSTTDIGLEEIRNAVLERAACHLSKYLEANRKKGRERIETFAATTAPRYRPILSHIPPDKLCVDPAISDKDLELTLHKHLSEIEGTLLSEGHDLMTPMLHEAMPEYEARLQTYLATARDIKKSDLANYVSHRKVILDLLSQAIRRDAQGHYAREGLIHRLIMPMRKDSNEVMSEDCNLWLIDERLAFHDYLASDKTLLSMPITGCTDTKEPDLCALNVLNNPILVCEGDLPSASLVIVEIKRPMRDDARSGEEKDPIEQALGYAEKIRNGKVQTVSGRPIPQSPHIPGFCYIICDLTPTVEERCKLAGLNVTMDHMGYFGYNPNYNAYIEVISFDRLVNAAKERNRAFFDKLGLPTS